MSFIKFGEFSTHYFIRYSLCSFLSLFGISTMHILIPLMVSHRSLRLCFFLLQFFFPFFFSDSVFPLFCLQLPLNPSSEFLISIIVLFSSRISFWCIFRFSISLLAFSFCSAIIFLSVFTSPCRFFFFAHLRQLFLSFCLVDLISVIFQG